MNRAILLLSILFLCLVLNLSAASRDEGIHFVNTAMATSAIQAAAWDESDEGNTGSTLVVDSTYLELCAGDSLWWHGNFYHTSGIYCDTSLSDTLSVLQLQILPPQLDTLINYGTLCSGGSFYIANYGTIYAPGQYITHTMLPNGCDSIVIYNIEQVQISDTILYDTICSGLSHYTANGFDISSPTTQKYTRYGGDEQGCGFYYILYLSEKTVSETNISATFTSGSTYNNYGFEASAAGTYRQELTGANGCDSVVILTLTLNLDADTLFNVEVVTSDSECQADGTLQIRLLGDSVPQLTQINYLVTGNGNSYQGVSANFSNLSAGSYMVTINGVLGDNSITKSLRATIGGNYIVPQASKVVGIGSNTYGTRHSFQCMPTGRIQVKITDGIFPYYVEVYKDGVYLRTDTINSYQHFGFNEASDNYLHYYNISDLDAGIYVLQITDGCGYTLPNINEEIRYVDYDYNCSVYPNSGNIKQGSYNIIPLKLLNYTTDTYKYYKEHTDGNAVWWEYSYSRDGINYSEWSDMPRDGVVYDTISTANAYCDIWGTVYTIRMRVKGCDEIACQRSTTINKPSYSTFTNLNDDGCSRYWGVRYNGDYYYTIPLTLTITDSTSGTILVNDSLIMHKQWQWLLYDPENYSGHRFHIRVVDNRGCELVNNIAIINVNQTLPTWNAGQTNFPCKQMVSIGFSSNKFKEGTRIELFESPDSNRYNYTAIYDDSTQTWSYIIENSDRRSDILYLHNRSFYLQDQRMEDGIYRWSITDDCGRTDTITLNALFNDYYQVDSFYYEMEPACDGIIIKPKGKVEYSNTNGTYNVTSYFKLAGGVSGGYLFSNGSTYGAVGSDSLLLTKPGQYVIHYYVSNSTNSSATYSNGAYNCFWHYDTIVYQPVNMAMRSAMGFVCLANDDDPEYTLGTIKIIPDSTTGVVPYTFTLYSEYNMQGEELESNQSGIFHQVGTVGDTLSVRITDGCGAGFVQNVEMVAVTIDPGQKAFSEKGIVCLDDSIRLYGLIIGIDSLASYTWITPMGDSVHGKEIALYADSAANGTYYLTITGVTCDLYDSIYVRVKDCIPCDSVFYVHDICRGETFAFMDTLFSETGIYRDTAENWMGCDSITILTLTVNSVYTIYDTVDLCVNLLPYLWNGVTFTDAATQSVLLTSSSGCDSTVVMTLQIHPTYLVSDRKEICQSDLPYLWNGVTFNQADVKDAMLTSVYGCDSLVTMTLVVHPLYYVTDYHAICPIELPYLWNGVTFNAAGMDSATLQTIHGCDSVVVMTLHIYPDYHIHEEHEVCLNDLPYSWGRNIYEEPGEQLDRFISSDGCDSIYYRNLIVHNTYLFEQFDTICEGEIFSFRGTSLSAQGIYYDSLLSGVHCDSVYALYLTIEDSMEIAVQYATTLCANDTHLEILYNHSDIAPSSYSILFNTKGKVGGFTDIVHADATLPIWIPLQNSEGKEMKPDIYQASLQFHSPNVCKDIVIPIEFTLLYPSDIIFQRWNDLLSVKNEHYNGGYTFMAYQWYKNGAALAGATHSYLYLENSALDLTAEYAVALKRQGEPMSVMSCGFTPTVEPDMVELNSPIEYLSSQNAILKVRLPMKGKAIVYNSVGMLLSEHSLDIELNEIVLPPQQGLYFVTIWLENQYSETTRIIVK